MDANRPLIEFSHVDINNGDSLVIEDLNFTLNKGDFVYLTGKVGSGKTSILRSFTAENAVHNGTARVGEFNLVGIKRKQIPYLRRTIGVVFQNFQLLMDRTVHENLEFVLRSTDWKDKRAIEDRICEVLQMVGLTSKAHKMPHQLSGGEQQRVAIARSLLNTPAVILADEPTGNLDNETAAGIMNLLCKINREEGTAIVTVTHNTALLSKYPGRTFVCKDNSCTELLNEQEIIDLDF
ncbi:MAG: ATP-binding cassette domain-containing protein [Bacteroidales bacterium]|nr:ATP-binding cassette domain-containing protein [Bacteroidales bacterium]